MRSEDYDKKTGKYIEVNGQFRSYNRHDEVKNKLVLSVFVREIEFIDELRKDKLIYEILFQNPKRGIEIIKQRIG